MKWLRRNRWRMTALSLGSLALTIGTLQFKGPDPAITMPWLLRDLVTRMNMGAIIITHDLGVVAHFCDRMAVMFAGGIVETGTVGDVFENPAHPYTSNLVDATPERLKIGRKAVFGGAPPDLYNLPDGCHHRDRCRFAREECSTPPPLREVGLKHVARCHFAGELPETAQ